MKTLIKILLILTLIILIFPLVKKKTENKEYQLKVHLYQEEEFSKIISNYLRIIPKKYLNKYDLIQVADSNKYQVYRHEDLILGIPRHSYLIYYKSNPKIEDLLSHNLVINAVKEGLTKDSEIENYYDLLLNKEEFNKLYHSYNEKKKMIAYCELLSTSLDTNTFSRIENISDIDRILKNRPKSVGNIIDFENNPENLNSSTILTDFDFLHRTDQTNNIYFWYYDQGIENFIFDFDDKGGIKTIKHRFIGYLGNEIMHL